MIVSLHIGEYKLDLFKDDNIEVNSSVANIKDITKNQTDYTKSFTVPASNNNNKLFKHYYDADIDDGFDARIKVDGEIRLDGLPFRRGKFRLYKVAIKKGVPSSYTISFFGKLLVVSDIVGKDYLSSLDFSALNHAYDDATVKIGLQSSLFGGDLIYNLLVKKKYYYSSDPSDTVTTDTLTNIGYGDGSGSNGVNFLDLRPSIKVIKIIEAIEEKYTIANGYASDIVFSRDFFGLTEFTDLYTWLNNTSDNLVSGGSQRIDFDLLNDDYMDFVTNIGTYPNIPQLPPDPLFPPTRSWRFSLTVTPTDPSAIYTIKTFIDNEEVRSQTQSGTDTFLWIEYLTAFENKETTLYYEISSDRGLSYSTRLRQTSNDDAFAFPPVPNLVDVFTDSSLDTISSAFDIANNLPNVKIIDFLKGLFNMFKLIVIQQDDGTTYVDTFDNYYLSGGLKDITRHIDFESYDVERGDILNEINFKFEEPTTILNTQFDINTGIPYGDEEAILKESDEPDAEVLDGTKSEFKLPFETILFERLTDLFTNDQSFIQYGAIIDDSLEPVNPKMTLFYNINQPLSGNQLGYLDDGSKTLLSGNINTPSHTDVFESPNFSTLFGAEFSTWDGVKINNTLYRNYHEDYILSIFNIKKRNYKYKAVLPLNIMLDLGLNDTLQIKDSFYRIDNFTTNLITGKVTLNLVSTFEFIGQ